MMFEGLPVSSLSNDKLGKMVLELIAKSSKHEVGLYFLHVQYG